MVSKTISGTTLINGSPVSRTVYIIRRDNGNLLGHTVSSTINGTWSYTYYGYSGEVLALATDSTYNAARADRVQP